MTTAAGHVASPCHDPLAAGGRGVLGKTEMGMPDPRSPRGVVLAVEARRQHHQRPWDGNHINGTISDTFWAVAPVGLRTFLAPMHTIPTFFSGFLLGYVIEEWCHHSVHYYVSSLAVV